MVILASARFLSGSSSPLRMDEVFLFRQAIDTGSGKGESEGCQSTPDAGQYRATAVSPHAVEHRNECSCSTC